MQGCGLARAVGADQSYNIPCSTSKEIPFKRLDYAIIYLQVLTSSIAIASSPPIHQDMP